MSKATPRPGEVGWGTLADPVGGGPGFERPAVIVANDRVNRSSVGAAVVVPGTHRDRRIRSHVRVEARELGQPAPTFFRPEEILTVDRSYLARHVGRMPDRAMEELDFFLASLLNLLPD